MIDELSSATLDLFDGIRFDGDDYVPSRDDVRLGAQIGRVFAVMNMGRWLTLSEVRRNIEDNFGKHDPEASISAQLRHLRKERFGGHMIEKRHRGPAKNGLYEYRLEL